MRLKQSCFSDFEIIASRETSANERRKICPMDEALVFIKLGDLISEVLDTS